MFTNEAQLDILFSLIEEVDPILVDGESPLVVKKYIQEFGRHFKSAPEIKGADKTSVTGYIAEITPILAFAKPLLEIYILLYLVAKQKQTEEDVIQQNQLIKKLTEENTKLKDQLDSKEKLEKQEEAINEASTLDSSIKNKIIAILKDKIGIK